jgi:Flp pilus assembly pilin Flp
MGKRGSLTHNFSMRRTLRFLEDESGQDLIEYTLLVAFVSVASAAAFLGGGNTVNLLWGKANTQLSNALVAAS